MQVKTPRTGLGCLYLLNVKSLEDRQARNEDNINSEFRFIYETNSGTMGPLGYAYRK